MEGNVDNGTGGGSKVVHVIACMCVCCLYNQSCSFPALFTVCDLNRFGGRIFEKKSIE